MQKNHASAHDIRVQSQVIFFIQYINAKVNEIKYKNYISNKMKKRKIVSKKTEGLLKKLITSYNMKNEEEFKNYEFKSKIENEQNASYEAKLQSMSQEESKIRKQIYNVDQLKNEC